MSKVPLALEELHRSENDLAGHLVKISDRHKADHEIFYVARDLARWSQEHIRGLARIGQDYGLDLDPEPAGDGSILATVRQKGDELLGRHHEASLQLLRDLRTVHRMAAGTSLDWEILAQTAQALKDTELLELAERYHPQTLRQMRWANAKLKESAAQVMVTP
jgi:hypothetical protein